MNKLLVFTSAGSNDDFDIKHKIYKTWELDYYPSINV